MKKLLLLLLIFISVRSFGQHPVGVDSMPLQTLGNTSNLVKARGAIGSDSGFVNARYPDTIAANRGKIKNYPGAQIRIGNTIWIRDTTATRWILGGGGSDTTLIITIVNDSTPNLQKVTDIGYTTTNPLVSYNSVAVIGADTIDNLNSVSSPTKGVISLNINTVKNPALSWTLPWLSGTTDLFADSADARTLQLPNNNGVLALSVNGILADVNGNIIDTTNRTDTAFIIQIIHDSLILRGPDTTILIFPLYAIDDSTFALKEDSLNRLDYNITNYDTTTWLPLTLITKQYLEDRIGGIGGGGGSFIDNQYTAKQTSPSRFWIDSGKVAGKLAFLNDSSYIGYSAVSAFPYNHFNLGTHSAINIVGKKLQDINFIPYDSASQVNFFGGLGFYPQVGSFGGDYGSTIASFKLRRAVEQFTVPFGLWRLPGGIVWEDSNAVWQMHIHNGRGVNVGSPGNFTGLMPVSKFEVYGNVAIGAGNAELIAAPANGLLVQGSAVLGNIVGGLSSPIASEPLLVEGVGGTAIIRIYDPGTISTTAQQLLFTSKTFAGANSTASIKSIATDAVGNGDLVFMPMLSGVATEKMKITSGGTLTATHMTAAGILTGNTLAVTQTSVMGNSLTVNSGGIISNATGIPLNAARTTANTSTIAASAIINSISSGTMADGFGGGLLFSNGGNGAALIGGVRTNASSTTADFFVQTYTAGTPNERFRVKYNGALVINSTNTTAGTTGAVTINKPSGTVNIAAAGTTVTVTNSLVSTSSLVFCEVRTNDATAYIKNVVPGAGSFVINLGAAATAEVSIGFFVLN